MRLPQYFSVFVLIAANLLALTQYYYFGWDRGEVLLLFWSESAIIGFFTIVKMFFVKGTLVPGANSGLIGKVVERANELKGVAKKTTGPETNVSVQAFWYTPQAYKLFTLLFLIPFFILHYGGFMMGHLFFLITAFIPKFSIGLLLVVLSGFVTLLISHGISFFTNYIGNKEYEKADARTLLFEPYSRIILMQFALIVGSILNASVLVLFAGKIIMDVIGHLQERRHFQY